MKKLLVLAFASLASLSALADGVQHVCKEIDPRGDLGKIIILTQTGSGDLHDGSEREPFTFTMFNNGLKTPVVSTEGSVSVEDVSFEFTSTDQNVVFSIYLDEMDRAYLAIRGQENREFDCR